MTGPSTTGPSATGPRLAGPPGLAGLVPVTRDAGPDRHTIGAFVLDGERVRWQPAVDVERLVRNAMILVGLGILAAAARAVAKGQRAPRVGRITMGPGGWVSMKGSSPAPSGVQPDRPWWAKLLGAHPLLVPGRPASSGRTAAAPARFGRR